MAKLIYASNVSLDGCTEDERGALDWATPDDDVFAFITDLMRSGRRPRWGQAGAADRHARRARQLLDERRFSNGVVHLRYRPL